MCKPGDDMAKVIGADDHVVEFEITPNRPDCLSRYRPCPGGQPPPSASPLKLHTPEVKGCGGSIAELVDIDIEDGDLCPRYTARMVKNVKIAALSRAGCGNGCGTPASAPSTTSWTSPTM